MELLTPGEPIGFDAEFQDVLRPGQEKWKHRLGWVAVVNTKLETILDVFVAYDREENTVKKYPPSRFGVGLDDLLFHNGAVRAEVVEKWLTEIFADRPVVMHDQRGDTSAFEHEDAFARAQVFDTQAMYGGRTGLGNLTSEVLGRQVQVGGKHTPTEDAIATMELFLLKHPYDRVAEKAKLAAQGLPTTSKPINISGHERQSKKTHAKHPRSNAGRALQDRAPNAVADRGEESWAGEAAFVRPARGSQRRRKGAKEHGQEN
jgi:RNA exonuclease 4